MEQKFGTYMAPEVEVYELDMENPVMQNSGEGMYPESF